VDHARAASEAAELCGGKAGEVVAVRRDPACGRPHGAVQEAEQGCLACAARADECHALAMLDAQIDAHQGGHRRVPDGDRLEGEGAYRSIPSLRATARMPSNSASRAAINALRGKAASSAGSRIARSADCKRWIPPAPRIRSASG